MRRREGGENHAVEAEGRIIAIEHVLARVCLETGEPFFSPETTRRIPVIVGGGGRPARTMQTPVYEFAT
jgi:hypothetical protein